MTREVVVVGAVRTPIGKFSGSLTPLSAPELGSLVIRETLERSGIDSGVVDEVIMGNALGDDSMTAAGAMGYAMESCAVNEYWQDIYRTNLPASYGEGGVAFSARAA